MRKPDCLDNSDRAQRPGHKPHTRLWASCRRTGTVVSSERAVTAGLSLAMPEFLLGGQVISVSAT